MGDSTSRKPVDVGTSHIERLSTCECLQDKSGTNTRKQVIVVLTASWQLLCFDHNLQLLWESSLQHEFPGHTVQREVAILVTNHTMLADDHGTVIVGVSMEIEQMTTVRAHLCFFC